MIKETSSLQAATSGAQGPELGILKWVPTLPDAPWAEGSRAGELRLGTQRVGYSAVQISHAGPAP